MSGLDSYVTGLYSFNNNVEDRSGNGVDFSSSVGYSDTNKKFGSHALYCSGHESQQTTGQDGQFSFGSGDFTIDFWFRDTRSDTSGQVLLCTDETSNSYWRIMREGDGDIEFTARNTSNSLVANFETTNTPCATHNQWYHVALVRNGNDEYIFVDGQECTLSINTGFSSSLGTASTAPLKIGYDQYDTYSYWGYIDELRISKGIARYTTNFDVPTTEYSSADISGYLSEEARIVILDETNWEIEHNSVHSAGNFIIPEGTGPGTKSITAYPTDTSKAPVVYTGIVPVA